MPSTVSDKHVTVGNLEHFASRYTSEVLNPALNTYSEAYAHDLSLENNILTLSNSTGGSLASVSLPSACGFNIEIVSELPENPDSNTLYFIRSGSSNDPGNQELTGPVRVVTYTPEGDSDENPFNSPVIALSNGDYVSRDLDKVWAFDSNGVIKATFGDNKGDISGDVYGMFGNVSDMCMDSDGYLYVIWTFTNTEYDSVSGTNTVVAHARITKLSYDGTSFSCVANYALPFSEGYFQLKSIIYNSARNKLIVARNNNNNIGVTAPGDIIQVNMDFSGYARISPEGYESTYGTSVSSMAMTSDGLCLYVSTLYAGLKKLIYDSVSSTVPSSVDTSFATIFPGNSSNSSTYQLAYMTLTSDDSYMLFTKFNSRFGYDTETPFIQKIDLVNSDHTVETIQTSSVNTDNTYQYMSKIIAYGNDVFTYVINTYVSDELTEVALYRLNLSADSSGSGSNSGTVVEPVEENFSSPTAIYTTDNLSIGAFIRLSDGKYAYIQKEDQTAGKQNSIVFLNADGTVAGTHVFADQSINGPLDMVEGPDGCIYINENHNDTDDNWYLHKYSRNGTTLSLVTKMTIPNSQAVQVIYNAARNKLIVSCLASSSSYDEVYAISTDLTEMTKFLSSASRGMAMSQDGLSIYRATNSNRIYITTASSLDDTSIYNSGLSISNSKSLPYSADLVKNVAVTDDNDYIVYASDSMLSIYKMNISTNQTTYVKSDCLVKFLKNNGGDRFTWSEENTSAGTVTFYRMDM